MKTILSLFFVFAGLTSTAYAEGFGTIVPDPRPPIIDPPQVITLQIEQFGQIFFVTVPVNATDAEIQDQIEIQVLEI